MGVGKQPDAVEVGGVSVATARFEGLYERHLRAVTAYCRRRLPADQVADGVADTFLVVWRRIDDVPDGDAERLWLYRVAHRVVGQGWRSARRHRRLSARVASLRPVGGSSTEEAVVDGDEVERVLEAMSRLKPADVEVLRLSVWERLSPAEIAEVLQMAPNAVHQRLHRARLHLLREYDALGHRSSIASTPVESGGER